MRRGLRSRLGRSGVTVAIIGAIALLAALWFQGRTGGSDAERYARFVDERAADPVEMISRAAGSRRVVVIGDIDGMSAPKKLAAGVLRAFARESGVDALVVDVDSSYQTALDRYISTAPEDASILMREAGLIDGTTAGRDMLELFREVYRLNVEVGADRRIRIIAAAGDGWPPRASLSPKAAAQRFAQHGTNMAQRIDDEILGRTSGTRIVALVESLQALKGGGAEVAAGGGAPTPVHWMAAELAERHPVDVYTVLPDAPLENRGYPLVARYGGTTLYSRLRPPGSGSFAVPVVDPIRSASAPVKLRTGPGVSLKMLPDDYTLGTVADAYVRLVGDGA